MSRHLRLLEQAEKQGHKFVPFKMNGAVLINGRLYKVWGIKNNALVIDPFPMDQEALNKPQNKAI